MSNLNLPLTSEQICQTISESYNRLSNNYVGPFCITNDACSGFQIQNANGCPTLIIGNSSIDFCQNVLQFNCTDSNLNFYFANDREFSLSNNTSNFSLSNNSTALFGLGTIDTSYDGIQIVNINPSIVLTDTNIDCKFLIQFNDCNGDCSFYLCHSGQNTKIASNGKIGLKSANQDTVFISGQYLSLNSDINENYNSYISGESFFEGNLYVSGGTNLYGSLSLDCDLVVSGCSEFTGNARFFSSVCVCNTLYVENCIVSKNSTLQNITSDNSIITSLTTQSLTVNNSASFGGNVNFSGISGFSSCFDYINLTSGIVQNLVTNNFNASGYINLISDTGIFSINGLNGSLNFTGDTDQLNIVAKCTSLTGSLCVSENIRADLLSLTGTGLSCIASSLCLDILCSNQISSYSGNIPNLNVPICLIACDIRVGTINQIDTGLICYATDELRIGSNNQVNITSGSVGAKNTAKSWGSIWLCNGAVTDFSGFNISGVGLPLLSQGSSTTYSIKLKDYITGPFSFLINNLNSNLSFTGLCATGCSSQVHYNDLIYPNAIPLSYGTSYYLSTACENVSLLDTGNIGNCWCELYFSFINQAGFQYVSGCQLVNFQIFSS